MGRFYSGYYPQRGRYAAVSGVFHDLLYYAGLVRHFLFEGSSGKRGCSFPYFPGNRGNIVYSGCYPLWIRKNTQIHAFCVARVLLGRKLFPFSGDMADLSCSFCLNSDIAFGMFTIPLILFLLKVLYWKHH